MSDPPGDKLNRFSNYVHVDVFGLLGVQVVCNSISFVTDSFK